MQDMEDIMNVNDLFIENFIQNIRTDRHRLLSASQIKPYIVDYFLSNGIEITKVFSGAIPTTDGPVITIEESVPEKYVIVITNGNTFAALKQLCIGAIIIASGKNAVAEYISYTKQPEPLALLYQKAPSVRVHLDDLLAAFMT